MLRLVLEDALTIAKARCAGTRCFGPTAGAEVLLKQNSIGARARSEETELVKEFIAALPPGCEPAQPQPRVELGLQCRELEEVNRELRGLIEAIAEGPHFPRGLQAKPDELEQGKRPTIKLPDPDRLLLRRIGVRWFM